MSHFSTGSGQDHFPGTRALLRAGREVVNCSVSEPASPVTPCGRPIGQKAAKHKLRMDEVERSKITVLEEMAQATKERNEIMRQANRIKIVTTSLNDLDEISTKILKLEKQKILDELLCESEVHDSAPGPSNPVSDAMIELATTSTTGEQPLTRAAHVKLEVKLMGEDCGSFDPESLIVSDYDSD